MPPHTSSTRARCVRAAARRARRRGAACERPRSAHAPCSSSGVRLLPALSANESSSAAHWLYSAYAACGAAHTSDAHHTVQARAATAQASAHTCRPVAAAVRLHSTARTLQRRLHSDSPGATLKPRGDGFALQRCRSTKALVPRQHRTRPRRSAMAIFVKALRALTVIRRERRRYARCRDENARVFSAHSSSLWCQGRYSAS